MQSSICSRCKRNPAVIFITRIENGKSSNEGVCLKCARELNIKPVEDIIRRMGLTDEDLESLTDEMMEAMGGFEGLNEQEQEGQDDNTEDGKTATFPFRALLSCQACCLPLFGSVKYNSFPDTCVFFPKSLKTARTRRALYPWGRVRVSGNLSAENHRDRRRAC